MNFTDPMLKLSVRTQDIGSYNNYTLTYWPVDSRGVSEHENGEFSFAWTSKYDVLGISGNWIGDDRYAFPAFVMDGVNDRGLSCSMLALVGTKYEKPRPKKNNLFYGTFCLWALQTISSVEDLSSIIDDISIWGPAILSEHFVIRDAAGQSMVIELIDGEKHVYWDANDGVNGFGILTNEPTFDWHISNIQHYEWKRTLARQAVEVPGGWYPEVLNTITVPEGFQYGTDTGETSGEGSGADHTMFGLIRDHSEPAIYW
ncbi:cbh [Symbiodinium microadriaticum]|nr:cbh [Symbiodinium microadriaticum]